MDPIAFVAYQALIKRIEQLQADPEHDPQDMELAVFMKDLVDKYLMSWLDFEDREFYLEP